MCAVNQVLLDLGWPGRPHRVIHHTGAGYEIDHHLRQLLALIFLEEVPGIANDRVALAVRAGHQCLKYPIAAGGYRVAVAEGRQKRLLTLPQHGPRTSIRLRSGIVWRCRNQHREGSRTSLVGLVRKGCIVGRYNVGGQFGFARALDNPAAV